MGVSAIAPDCAAVRVRQVVHLFATTAAVVSLTSRYGDQRGLAQIEAARHDEKLYKGKVRVCTACSCVDGTNALPDILHLIDLPGAHSFVARHCQTVRCRRRVIASSDRCLAAHTRLCTCSRMSRCATAHAARVTEGSNVCYRMCSALLCAHCIEALVEFVGCQVPVSVNWPGHGLQRKSPRSCMPADAARDAWPCTSTTESYATRSHGFHFTR